MTEHEVGPEGNVFEALGFEQEMAANLLIRSDLMIKLSRFIMDKEFTLRSAGEFFGISHTRVNDILQGNIDKFTIDYLVNLLSQTGQSVTLHIERPSSE